MIIFNFGHPLTDSQKQAIETAIGTVVERVVEIPTQFDHQKPFSEQVTELIDRMGVNGEEWQTLPFLVNPPSFAAITAALVAEIHGRCGYFPSLIRLRPVVGATPPRFEFAEIINLQAIRDTARSRRHQSH